MRRQIIARPYWVEERPEMIAYSVDATTHFYSVHFIYEDIFGDDLGYTLLRDEGMNNYSLAFFASEESLEDKESAVDAFVKVTQRAYAYCLRNSSPCSAALSSAVSLKLSDAERQFEYASRIMPGIENDLPVGAWDFERLESDFIVVQRAYGLENLDTSTAFTNKYIDTSVSYPQ